jgi:hypothetical protein
MNSGFCWINWFWINTKMRGLVLGKQQGWTFIWPPDQTVKPLPSETENGRKGPREVQESLI